MRIDGRCHCGNVRFALDWVPEPLRIPARACGCTFCLKHGGVWTSCPTGSLTVHVAEPAAVSAYAFGTGTARFHVCSRCGVVPVVTSVIDGTTYAVVNVNALEALDPTMIERDAVSFDGETTAERLARRKNRWIPRVEFRDGAG